MDIYIVKNEKKHGWVLHSALEDSLGSFSPLKTPMLEMMDDAYWVRNRPLIVS